MRVLFHNSLFDCLLRSYLNYTAIFCAFYFLDCCWFAFSKSLGSMSASYLQFSEASLCFSWVVSKCLFRREKAEYLRLRYENLLLTTLCLNFSRVTLLKFSILRSLDRLISSTIFLYEVCVSEDLFIITKSCQLLLSLESSLLYHFWIFDIFFRICNKLCF